MERKFSSGQAVHLKTGGRKMTVMKYLNNAAQIRFNETPNDTGMIRCNWFEGEKVISAEFHQDSLEAVKARSQT